MTRNQCSVFYYKIFIFIVIVRKVVYGTQYTVGGTCHGYLGRRVKMKMTASCRTVKAYWTALYLCLLVIVQKIVYGAQYTVGGTCHGYLGRRVKMKMAASCKTLKAYGAVPYLRYEKAGQIKGKQDNQKEEKRRHD